MFLREHLKQLLEDGVIEPSNSQYSSPMFLVPKGENNYRAVVDFRALNKKIAIESDTFSLPLVRQGQVFHHHRFEPSSLSDSIIGGVKTPDSLLYGLESLPIYTGSLWTSDGCTGSYSSVRSSFSRSQVQVFVSLP